MRAAREPVGRALDVLAWIADHASSPLGVRQIARDLGTSPSTVHRIFQTFQERSLIGRDDDGEYIAGLELYRICAAIANELSPARIAHPHLLALARDCGETTLFGLYDAQHRQMMFIDKIEALHPLRYIVELHRWVPVYAGATGLAILAFLPEEERRHIYADGLESLTAATIVAVPKIEAELSRVREQGYACSIGQRVAGAVGFAAPVFDSVGMVCGDMCVTLPEQRFKAGEFAESLAAMLKAASQSVTNELKSVGYRAPVSTELQPKPGGV